MNTKRTIWLAVVVMSVVGLSASAGMIDLTTAGASVGPVNGAIFTQQTFDTSTGTGLFDPFVRIQGNVTEQGYNTAGDLEWDTKAGIWTHPIQLADIPVVGDYYEFRLDINQNKGGDGEYLSLDALKIHIVSAVVGGALTGYETNPAFGAPAWDLGDNWVKLNYQLNPGSGNGDMILLVPINALGTTGTDYVYLYSKFGVNCESNDGFEEWGVLVPEPATMILLGLGSVLLRRRK